MVTFWRDLRTGLLSRPWRSIFLLLIFAFGVASVFTVTATVEGGRRSIRDSLYNMGIDVIAALNPLRIEGMPLLKLGTGGDRLIDVAAYQELKIHLGDKVAQVLPFRLELVRVFRGSLNNTTTLLATDGGWFNILKSGMLCGRFYTSEDYVEGGPVPVVLDEAAALLLSPEKSAEELLHKKLIIRRGVEQLEAQVLGVMKDPLLLRKHLQTFDTQRKARTLSARRLEFMNIYVPFSVAGGDPTGILVQVHDVEQVDFIGEEMAQFFGEHGIKPYYHVMKTWVDFVLVAVNNFSFLSNFFWIANLLVVLIIAATTAWLAIEQRFQEFAIRRVEGATILQIVLPVLAEGAVLAFCAAPLGYLASSWFIEIFIVPMLGWEPVFVASALWSTPLLITIVGVLAYTLPAKRVAALPPAIILGKIHD